MGSYTLEGFETFTQEIKRSRFVAMAGPASDEQAAKHFIETNSDPEATHNCWAWRIGAAYRFSDDGEPGGTAGRPILQAIEGQSLDRVVVLVTRWFGGILLGSGGLVRAYGGTAASCLRNARRVEIIERVEATVSCGFSDLALLTARLHGFPGLQVASENFTATGADLVIAVPRPDTEQVARLVADTTSGRASFKLEQG